MARFSRRRDSDELGWVRRLPDPFSMRELLQVVEDDNVAQALTWLYAAIERGRVEPLQAGDELRYHFAGDRRGEDLSQDGPGDAETAGGRR